MYGLPSDIDLTFFHGSVLTQVCIGANDLVLNFGGDDISMTVTSRIQCRDMSGTSVECVDFRLAASLLVNLLEQTIVAAGGDEAGTLGLEFGGGGRIDIFDDSKIYESYTISIGDRIIVV